jgi:hypothetical protein
MELIDHGMHKGPPQRLVTFPIVQSGIDYDIFHRSAGVVVTAAVFVRDRYSARVRVQQHFSLHRISGRAQERRDQ